MPAPVTREQLLQDLQRVANKLGKTPTQREYQKHGNHAHSTLRKKFGRFNEALAAIGHKPNKVGEVSAQELLDDIERVANDLGETPAVSDYDNLGEYHPASVNRKIGGWNQALQKLELDPNKILNIPDDDLLADLERVSNAVDGTLTKRKYQKDGEYSPKTIKNRFGWQEAGELISANFNKSNFPEKFSGGGKPWFLSDEKLLNDIVTHAEGRLAPSYNEYKSRGEHSTKACQKRFNSWWEAVVRAGLQPRRRRPLRPYLHHKLYEIGINSDSPENAVHTLLFLFTGLPRNIAQHFTSEWIADRRDRHIVRVPAKYTDSGDPWLFRIPELWYDPYVEEMRPTHLPSLLDWYWQFYDHFPKAGVLRRHCLTIGQGTPLEIHRNTRFYAGHIGVAPQIRASDLRITQGVNLARRGIDPDTIKQRLGMNNVAWDACVRHFFLWVYVHEGYEHSDYNPPNIVFDPV